MAAKADIKNRLYSVAYALPLAGIGLLIREHYGIDALHEAEPYLLGGPFVCGLLLIGFIQWRARGKAKSERADGVR